MGNTHFKSSVFRGLRDPLSSLISLLKCRQAEHLALLFGITQSKRFGGRYIFIAPSGLAYCASPLPGELQHAAQYATQGAVAGPFLMTEHDDYLSVDVIPKRDALANGIADIYKTVELIPYKTPVQARAACEMLALCAENCRDTSGPFSVPYNEALAASIRHMDVLSRATKYIQNNYMKKIKLGDIAEHVFISSSYFSKIFREEMGQTPGSYITATRIEASKSLLRDPSVNLVEISEIVGFESQSYFTRVFKRMEGITPGEYRMKSRQV
jgi:AraC-like DNA-binding protein